jgi:DNA end-binding protein Ku
MLHNKDGSRLRQQYVCQKEGVVVSRNEIVRGYEFAKDQYVMFTPEELKALEEASSSAVDVTEFVPLESVDPVYYDRTYYLAPDKGGAKPYTLFTMALREKRRCAVGRWAARGKDLVVILRPVESALVMHQLHFAPEVLPISELGVEAAVSAARIRDPELKLAGQLIDQQTHERFDPAAYRNQVKDRIEDAIEKKVEGEQITISEPRAAAEGKVVDLMEALRKSLQRNAPAPDETERPNQRKPPRRVHKKTASHRKTSQHTTHH